MRVHPRRRGRDHRERRHACRRHRNAIIIGFNVRPDANAREAAEREKYGYPPTTASSINAIEDVEKAMKGMLGAGIPRERHRSRGGAQRVQDHRRRAPLPAAMSPTASSSATRRCACCATTWWFTRASSPRSSASRTTSRKSPTATSAACALEKLHRYQGRRRHRVLRDGGNSAVIDCQGQQARPGCMLCRRAAFFSKVI